MVGERQLFESLELRRENLNEQIANMIQGMISSHELQAGSRLPSERELATMLNVNRATVREAIQILQQRGLVEMRVGSGAYVTQVSPEVVGDAIVRYFTSRRCSQRDLQAVRNVIEPEIAALAAANADAEDLDNLARLLKRLEVAWATEDSRIMAAADADFHLGLAVASHNDLFVAIVSGLSLIMKEWIGLYYDRERAAASLPQHHRIYEAVAASDPGRVRDMMKTHMAMVPMVEDSA